MSDNRQAQSDTGMERLPVSVLTGFLGSGKTTLLNKLLKHPDMGETAVVINEFGEVGIDNLLVESATEDMIVMDSGCLCCTIRGDLIDTLRDLIRRRWKEEIPPFKRLVIETTGLADPAPILHTLMTDPVISSRYRLDGVISTVDAATGGDSLDRQPEAVKQAAVADRLLMTKRDLVTDAGAEDLSARLRGLNPAAPIHSVSHGDVDPALLFEAGLFNPEQKSPDVRRWLAEEAFAEEHDHDHSHDHDHDHSHHHHNHHHHDPNRHDDGIHAFCLTWEPPIIWDGFVEWIDALTVSHGPNLLRMKGILNVVGADGPVAVHGVQHVFHPPAMLESWPDEERVSKLVIIARDVKREPVEQMFKAFMETAMKNSPPVAT